jgi:hypothetical protein
MVDVMQSAGAVEQRCAPEPVLALGDHEVAILKRDRVDLEEDFMGLERGDVALRLDEVAELARLGQAVLARRLREGHGECMRDVGSGNEMGVQGCSALVQLYIIVTNCAMGYMTKRRR